MKHAGQLTVFSQQGQRGGIATTTPRARLHRYVARRNGTVTPLQRRYAVTSPAVTALHRDLACRNGTVHMSKRGAVRVTVQHVLFFLDESFSLSS